MCILCMFSDHKRSIEENYMRLTRYKTTRSTREKNNLSLNNKISSDDLMDFWTGR
jgi:hypothetical protein